mgnify:CR=1 FL=1
MIDLCGLHWLAGIVEGEGSFFIRKTLRGRYPTIAVSMSDEDVIRKLAAMTGVGTISETAPIEKHHKTQWRWQVAKTVDVIDLMKRLQPLMGKRRRKRIDEILNEFESPVPLEYSDVGNRSEGNKGVETTS